MTDPLGRVTTYGYDIGDRLRTVTQEGSNGPGTDDRTWAYGYDLLGQETLVVDPVGLRTQSTYDAAGRMLTQSEVPADLSLASTWTYQYDDASRLVRQEDPTGVYTEFQ